MDEYLKENWNNEFKNDFENLPPAIKELAGDIFELTWYGYSDLKWELINNWGYSPEKTDEIINDWNNLNKHQKNLILYAYEA